VSGDRSNSGTGITVSCDWETSASIRTRCGSAGSSTAPSPTIACNAGRDHSPDRTAASIADGSGDAHIDGAEAANTTSPSASTASIAPSDCSRSVTPSVVTLNDNAANAGFAAACADFTTNNC